MSMTDVTTAVQKYADDAVAAQKATDAAALVSVQGQVTSLTSQLAAAHATISDLEAKLAAVTPPVITPPTKSKTKYGANTGGQKGEAAATAYARIKKGFGGMPAWRWWANTIPDYTKVPAFVDKDTVIVTEWSWDLTKPFPTAAITAALKALPKDRQTVQIPFHEKDLHVSTDAELAIVQDHWVQFGKLHKQFAPASSKFCVLLTEGSLIKGRVNGTYTAQKMFNFDLTNVDYIGFDIYQHGQTDAAADTADVVVKPCIDFAKSKNKPLLVGEIGARTLLSDAARAKFLTDAIAQLNAYDVPIALYYESWGGSLGPWNILDGKTPKAAAVWAAAVKG